MSNVAAYLVKEALKDGNEVTIRAMRPDDKERLVKAFLHLQPQTIRTRFFYPKRILSEDDLRWLDEMGHGNHLGLVATVPSGRDELIVGEGSYAALGQTAEIGFTVAEAWQGRGVASRLLQHLAGIARDQGVRRVRGVRAHGKRTMLAVFRHSGLPMTTRYAEGLLHVTLAARFASGTALIVATRLQCHIAPFVMLTAVASTGTVHAQSSSSSPDMTRSTTPAPPSTTTSVWDAPEPWRTDRFYFETSVYTRHYRDDAGHNDHQDAIVVEWNVTERWLVGASAFNNSYGQASQYVYGGYRFRPFESIFQANGRPRPWLPWPVSKQDSPKRFGDCPDDRAVGGLLSQPVLH